MYVPKWKKTQSDKTKHSVDVLNVNVSNTSSSLWKKSFRKQIITSASLELIMHSLFDHYYVFAYSFNRSKMSPSSSSCKRRLSALHFLRQKIHMHDEDTVSLSSTHHNYYTEILPFAKNFVENDFPSEEMISSSCCRKFSSASSLLCPVCVTVIDQRKEILEFIKFQEKRQQKKLETERQRQKEAAVALQKLKRQQEEEQHKLLSASAADVTTSEIKQRGGKTDNSSSSSKKIPNQSSKSTDQNKDGNGASLQKKQIINEVESFLQEMKDNAKNLAKKIHDSNPAYEQRQQSLESQVQDTTSAAKKAGNVENEVKGAAGIVGEFILRMLGKVMPPTVVNLYFRPFIESLFQIIWIVICSLVTVMTIYLMISAPKGR